MSQQASAPAFAMPQGASTGSPWEQNMQAQLARGTPQDLALQQQYMARQAAAGTGPQFQGAGRPGWQTSNAGQDMQRIADSMGKSIPQGANAGQAARQAGYYASQPTSMGQLWRSNPTQLEVTKWMGRG